MTKEELVSQLNQLGFRWSGFSLNDFVKDLGNNNWACINVSVASKSCKIHLYDNDNYIVKRETLTYQETLNKFKND